MSRKSYAEAAASKSAHVIYTKAPVVIDSPSEESISINLGYMDAGSIHDYGWIQTAKDYNRQSINILDPEEIVLKITKIVIEASGAFKTVASANDKGFTRRELAEAIAVVHMSTAKDEDKDYMFSTYHGMMEYASVVMSTNPLTVFSDLDY